MLEALTADPVAGREVLLALDDLDVLLGPHLDGDRARPLPARGRRSGALPGRRDASRSSSTSSATSRRHRNVAASSVSTRDLHDWLGVCLAPYLLQLVPSPSVPVDGWGSTDVVGLLTWVSESQLSAAAIFAARAGAGR